MGLYATTDLSSSVQRQTAMRKFLEAQMLFAVVKGDFHRPNASSATSTPLPPSPARTSSRTSLRRGRRPTLPRQQPSAVILAERRPLQSLQPPASFPCGHRSRARCANNVCQASGGASARGSHGDVGVGASTMQWDRRGVVSKPTLSVASARFEGTERS